MLLVTFVHPVIFQSTETELDQPFCHIGPGRMNVTVVVGDVANVSVMLCAGGML